MKSTKKLPLSVIPAQAGIQVPPQIDSRLRGNDGGLRNSSKAVLDSSDPIARKKQLSRFYEDFRKLSSNS
jgi:hypothetical protein